MIPGRTLARWATLISLVDMGSWPESNSGPMEPPSTTMVKSGAWGFLAKAAASRGMPTPANTDLTPASWRAAITASNSAGE